MATTTTTTTTTTALDISTHVKFYKFNYVALGESRQTPFKKSLILLSIEQKDTL